jgi:hypothetical protein
MKDDDERLKRSFHALRRHEERHAPPFKLPPARPADRSRAKVIALFAAPAAALAIAATAMLFLMQAERSSSRAAEVATPAQAEVELAPLDFLLDVPAGSVISNRPIFDERNLSEVRR